MVKPRFAGEKRQEELSKARLAVRLKERGKPHNVVTVAVARELAGFLWAAAVAP